MAEQATLKGDRCRTYIDKVRFTKAHADFVAFASRDTLHHELHVMELLACLIRSSPVIIRPGGSCLANAFEIIIKGTPDLINPLGRVSS